MSFTGTRAARKACLAAALFIAACGGGGGGATSSAPPAPPPATFTDATVYSTAASASLQSPSEAVSVTRHQLVLGGATLAYTATAGHLVALAPVTRAPQASFFYVAYTLDGAAPATRPVTFFYNGGPGSASVWLHLGSFGPRRIAAAAPAYSGTRPFPLVDNAESLLDMSDLVFVDAVGTGYSQAVAPNTNSTFWSVDADAAVFRDFVMRYLEVNNRATSPKYLFGESYGGPRSAILATLLETAGVELAGVVLQSPAMDYGSLCDVRAGQSCATFFPSYGATGAWHGLAAPSPPAPQIPDYMAQMRAYTQQVYAPAVDTFLATLQLPRDDILNDLVAKTGMQKNKWQGVFNPGPLRFRTNVEPGTLLGRYDSRVRTANVFVAGNEPDPASIAIDASFNTRINDHLANTLRYTTPSTYTLFENATIQGWRFAHAGAPIPDTIPDLAAALALNPRLRILAVNGYHDLATPFYNTERDLARLGATAAVTVRNYLGGHMTYLDDATRAQQKADLAQFYRGSP